MSQAATVLQHVWELREMMHRLGLAPPLSTAHVRRQVGRARLPQRLLPTRFETHRPPSHAPDPMPLERKALVVTYMPGDAEGDAASPTVDALTDLLNDDWRIVSATAMGGAGGGDGPVQFAALVVVEREEKKTVGGFGAR